MKKKKPVRVDVDVLEQVGDGDRFLVRYFVPELGLQAVEWVSVSGIQRWLATSANTTIMNSIMGAILTKIEETQKEVQENGSKTDPETNEMD